MKTRWAKVVLSTIAPAVGVTAAVAAGIVPDYSPPPGAVNPQVTQSNINTTICVRGWTQTIRPPIAYTDNLKRQQMTQRHLPGSPADYEEDHWIPLEIGGNPRDPKNLWPQPNANVGPAGDARLKDKLENALNTAVCGRKMTLADAQKCLLNQPTWTACARRMHTPVP